MNHQVPFCPIHQQPMRAGNFGYHCTFKMGVGVPGANDNGYCTQRAGTPMQGRPPQAPQARQQAPQCPQQPVNRDRSIQVQCAIKCACIRFSGMDVSDETVMMFASILDSAITRGSRGPSMPSLAPVPRKPESPENYGQPDPPEWTAPHPDEPPPDDNDPWAQDWQNRSRA